MKQDKFLTSSNSANSIGEVIEIYEKNDTKFVKLLFNPFCLDIHSHLLTDIHLSDKVKVECKIIIDNAEIIENY